MNAFSLLYVQNSKALKVWSMMLFGDVFPRPKAACFRSSSKLASSVLLRFSPTYGCWKLGALQAYNYILFPVERKESVLSRLEL
ncbi:MAG: hypothetical protein B9J98_00245 [Candidatus Terraquivivens tikiterensis]|uniref:Uncharacterized protein n=1 Tax=Candidatus Terraquivivens tikiterensis TaxID=1980982 RepID=A0A2R7Y9X3_9ARCH|nr:MAG: hypothetical protein B9J98_00245 [Candidatus Terraquivivens tikiterensis]